MKTFRFIAVSILCCTLILSSGKIAAQARATTAPTGLYKTIYDMLKEVPGLEVVSNNGRGSTVIVRGLGTLKSGSIPLYVLDGSIYTGDVSNLNPQEIESIIVMKDGASTSAYGSQGANGVIQLTSKKGSNAAQRSASVESHTESAYTYFIDHKTPLRVFGQDDKVIIEGVIEKQRGDSLIFIKKRKDFPVAIANVKRVEMIPQQ